MQRHLGTYRAALALGLFLVMAGAGFLLPRSSHGGNLCGNGSIDAVDEECDDGNTEAGDCCSATCQLEPAGTHCNNHAVCAAAGACSREGSCMDVGCKVGAQCGGGGCSADTYCAYPSGGPCSCSAAASAPLPDCAQLTWNTADEALVDKAAASLQAKGLDISQVGPEEYFWILLTEVSPIAGCEMQ
jgi:cysteine-rich repeat protein